MSCFSMAASTTMAESLRLSSASMISDTIVNTRGDQPRISVWSVLDDRAAAPPQLVHLALDAGGDETDQDGGHGDAEDGDDEGDQRAGPSPASPENVPGSRMRSIVW